MAQITKVLFLDVAKKNRLQALVAKQYDNKSRFLKVRLQNEGEDISVEASSSVIINALRADGASKGYGGAVNDDGTVTVPITAWMLGLDDIVTCDISIIDANGRKLTSTSFEIEVEPASYDGSDISDDENYDLLVTLIRDVSSTVDEMQAVVAEAQYIIDEYDIDEVRGLIAQKADNLYFDSETNLLYLMSDGEIIGDGVAVATSGGGGGGGGGGGTSYIVTLANALTSRNITVATGSAVVLAFNYSSVDSDSMDDGPGIGTLTINGTKVATFNMQQGANILDISGYLSAGTNNVRVKVENSEGSVKTLAYTATVVSLSMSTTLDELATYAGAVLFSYTLSGSGTKTVHFLMDGEEIDTATVTTSGRSNSYTITAQSAGAHVFSAYAEVSVDGVTVQSNTVRLGMLWIDESSTDPVLASTFAKATATQGETLEIPYMVYDPSGESATITLVVLNPDGTAYSSNSITVDRTRHTWNVSDYPSGNVKFRISCGGVNLDLPVAVSAYTLPVSPVSDGLLLEFSADGRSNAEENPNQWEYGDIAATFNGFGWSNADGWISDANGAPVLRFLPGDTMDIPLEPFASDARDTGYTIEVELATRDVRDYDSIAFSCLSGGRGVKIASQEATLKSEQSTVSMLFKEDSRVRVTFVIEQRNLNRLIYIYINGIMCGVTQYPTNDNFAQASPVGLSIGSNTCGIDLYKIRCYNKGLTRGEQLDNFICDRSTLSERQSAYARNNILDESDEVVISKLPNNLPYLVIACPELPQYKGDKKTGVELSFVDPANTARSFNAIGVEMDVQGTSSAGYPVKNEKLKLKSGIQYTASGNVDSGFPISPGALPTVTICLKVDFASSENANNVMLADYYNSLCPYQTPAQEADPRVRQGIEGFACAIFWQNTATSDVVFIGKGNMNVDKGNPNIFGFTDDYPNAESWEFLNNTSNRTLFKTSDFGTGWTDDFEARFPEENTDTSKFKRFTDWLVSTNRDAAGLSSAQKAARLEKFRTEAEDYLELDAVLFYYLFTETFLMVDSRAKNMFMTTFDGLHWFSLPYDFDTAIGINNEGALVFEYDLEDTDQVNNANVFNGQTSTLWNNIRDAFGDELKSMYSSLRSGGNFSYQTIKTKMENHQSVWPEAMWNEDAFIKYLQPYLLNGENYLSMLQGSKSSQRDWWLFNAFRYRDSKYQCGDASANFITLRCYAVGNITVTPYSHIWTRVKYGSNTAFCRGKRNTAYEMVCTLDNMDDTEVYIYSADRIASIGSLSHLQVGYANFSMATKLQSIILGSDAEGYTNPKLEELYVGNNELLTEVNIENCVNLTMPIDLSGCASIATVKATGSAITGVNLPNGGHLTTLELPDTVTNFTIQNQHDLETLTFAGYDELTTLRVENTPNVPLEEIINGADNLNRVRLIGVEWDAEDETSLQATIDKLETCIGMDANGNNTVAAVVNGRVNVSSISSALLTEINETFPDLVVVVNGVPQYLIRFLNYDNSVVYRMVVAEGGNATDPVTGGLCDAPEKPGTDEVHYAFSAWSSIPTNVQGNQSVVAQYVNSYRVQYKNWDGTVLQTKYVVSGGTASYTGSTPSRASTAQYTYTFTGWSGTQTNITSARDITAQYSSTVRKYTVYFYNGSTLLQTVQNVSYGGSATYTGSTPVDPSGNNMPFESWSPSPTNITGNTSCYAQFASAVEVAEITDDWATILANVANGTYATRYKIGNYKPLDLGTEGVVNMQIAAINKDTLAAGGGTAHITWISKELLATSKRMNPSRSGSSGAYTEGTGAIGGWEKSEMRAYLKNTVKPLIPSAVRSAIVEVTKTQTSYNPAGSSVTQTTQDDVWLPAWNEISGSSAMYGTLFPDNASRIKYKAGASSASTWWTRQASSSYNFYCVTSSGSNYGSYAYTSYGVALGFCI